MYYYTLFAWNIHVWHLFHYSYSYSNVSYTRLKKESYGFWKKQDQPKPSATSFYSDSYQSPTKRDVVEQKYVSEPTESPSSSPKEFDVTFVSQGTYELNGLDILMRSLNRWDFMLEIASFWKGY